MCDGATCGIQSGRFDAGLFVFVSAVAHVFNCKIKRCVFLLSLLLIGNKCNYPQKGYKHISLALFVFFLLPSYRRPARSKPAYCTGFGIGGQGYRQMGVHLPACSTSHGTNVTTQRAFGCLGTTEKSHWHGWIDLIQMGARRYSCIRRPRLH